MSRCDVLFQPMECSLLLFLTLLFNTLWDEIFFESFAQLQWTPKAVNLQLNGPDVINVTRVY